MQSESGVPGNSDGVGKNVRGFLKTGSFALAALFVSAIGGEIALSRMEARDKADKQCSRLLDSYVLEQKALNHPERLHVVFTRNIGAASEDYDCGFDGIGSNGKARGGLIHSEEHVNAAQKTDTPFDLLL